MSKKRPSAPNISKEALERARRELQSGGTAPSVTATEDVIKAPIRPVKQREIEQPLVYSSTKRTMTREELASEYGYVIRDLTSMATLAAILFVVLIVVSLVVV